MFKGKKSHHWRGFSQGIFFQRKRVFGLFDCLGGWGWDFKPILNFGDLMYFFYFQIDYFYGWDDTCTCKTSIYAFILVCKYTN